MLKKTLVLSLFLLLAMSIMGAGASFGEQKFDRKFLKMVSGTSGGSWYPLGAGMMRIVQDATGISTSNGPGGGVSNMYAIQKGSADVALGYAHTITNAYLGRGKFKKPQNKLRFVAAFFPSIFQGAATKKSGITSYSQLKDKKIVPGKVGFTSTVIAEQVLKAYGISFKSIKQSGGTVSFVGFSDSAALVKDGHCDAVTLLTDCPAAVLIDLNFSPGMRMLGIDPEHMKKVLELEPGLIKAVIPKTAYKGMTEDVPTVSTATCLVIRDDVEDDVAYAVTKAIWDHMGELVKIKKIMGRAKLENALKGAKIPVHPGAMKFYKEHGVKID
ncbi:MAG: TAXI family TRAP transporter solute-binding subunit [Deltaproteobacteria bacterium]|nr:TAXI family TRAP transporter solute-binding subunit [Deltaproteobacteria bacterium]